MTVLGLVLGKLLLGAVLVVAPGGPYRTLNEAVAAAQPGDTIEVHGGVWAGPLVVDRPLTLIGVDAPVIDGGGRGTVVTLSAPSTVFRGFVVRGSGTDFNREDAGIEVSAPSAVVEANRVEDALNGISLDNAAHSVIRGNTVRGKDLPPASRGDGIRLWYSSDVQVEQNTVLAARDVVVWYSENLRFTGNRIEDGRYGLHFMNDDGADIQGNVLRHNSVGAYLMSSQRVTLRGNLLASSRGPSGYGLGLKDVDDLVFEQNWVIDNRVGVAIDNSPRAFDSWSRFHANEFAFNDIGIWLQPSIERNSFWGNSFRDNAQQVSLQGGGSLRNNHWSEQGQGNYWSDYRGFDADGDGVGDVAYRAEALMDDLMDRRGELRHCQIGLAADAVQFAADAFPALRPQPKLVDEQPLLAPPAAPPLPAATPADARSPLAAGAGLLGLAGAILAFARARLWGGRRRAAPGHAEAALAISGLTKRYGAATVLDGLSLSVRPGEVVALWGANGAGKTTALKCVLGLLPCTGDVQVDGFDALRDGKSARRALGYVPQEVAFHDDLTLTETVAFYARLKGVPAERLTPRLAALGLAEHAGKQIGQLSGGLRQRLALALALLGEPALLLLDEPTSNLDAASRELVVRALGELRQAGTAVLFASHRIDEIEALADRVLVLEHGRLAFECVPAELAERLCLQTNLHLRLAPELWPEAVAVLRAEGLQVTPNGRAIGVAVTPTEKARPFHLLARAGIQVTDFSLDDAATPAPSDGDTAATGREGGE